MDAKFKSRLEHLTILNDNFLLFPQFLLANVRITLLIISRKLPSTTYPVHYLLLSSHFALLSLHY